MTLTAILESSCPAQAFTSFGRVVAFLSSFPLFHENDRRYVVVREPRSNCRGIALPRELGSFGKIVGGLDARELRSAAVTYAAVQVDQGGHRYVTSRISTISRPVVSRRVRSRPSFSILDARDSPPPNVTHYFYRFLAAPGRWYSIGGKNCRQRERTSIAGPHSRGTVLCAAFHLQIFAIWRWARRCRKRWMKGISYSVTCISILEFLRGRAFSFNSTNSFGAPVQWACCGAFGTLSLMVILLIFSRIYQVTLDVVCGCDVIWWINSLY